MPSTKSTLRLVLRCLLAVLVVSSFGCGDDDDPVAIEEETYENPEGKWSVTNSNVVVQTGDLEGLPLELADYIQDSIKEVLGFGEASEWKAVYAAPSDLLPLLPTTVTKFESPVCLSVPYDYDDDIRSCTEKTPTISLPEQDVSDMGLCQDAFGISACVTKIEVENVWITPNLTWADDYKTFSGTETMNSQADPAVITVTVNVKPTIGTETTESYPIEVWGSRTVAGTRCSDCAPCQ